MDNEWILTPEEIQKCIDALPEESKELFMNSLNQTTNTVNHPTHYNRPGAMECIDEMLVLFGPEAVMNFCLCNAWKYRYRAMSKNGEEDLKKSDFYINKYKEIEEKERVLRQLERSILGPTPQNVISIQDYLDKIR